MEPSNHISVYGDESVNNNIVCYAVCIFATNYLERANNIMHSIKKEFGIEENYFLHSNELFNGNQRAKLNCEIDLQGVENLYRQIAHAFRTVDMVCCYADKRKIKKEKEIIEWGNGNKTDIYFANKELTHLCKNACMIDVVRQKKEDEYAFYPDPDNDSRMKWNGKKKAKVNNQDYNLIVPKQLLSYEKEEQGLTRARQVKITGEKPTLIQLADFLAYSFAKAKSVQAFKNKDFFIEMIEILNPIARTFSL